MDPMGIWSSFSLFKSPKNMEIPFLDPVSETDRCSKILAMPSETQTSWPLRHAMVLKRPICSVGRALCQNAVQNPWHQLPVTAMMISYHRPYHILGMDNMDSTCLSSLPHDLPCRMSSKSCRDLQVDRSTSSQRFQLQIVGSLRRYLQQKGEACPAIQTFSVNCWENLSARWEQHQARV